MICEGLTERKRPKAKTDARRSSDFSTYAGQNGSAASSPEFAKAEFLPKTVPLQISDRGSSSGNALQRPTLKNLNFFRSDSGYSSGKQSSPHDSKAEDRARFEAVGSTLPSYESSSNVSPTNARSCDWNLAIGKDGYNYTAPDISNRGDLIPATASAESVGWLDPATQSTAWWSDDTSVTASATNLISTARLLEEQAQSLRRLASGQNTVVGNDNRRQTVTLPLPHRFNDTSPYPPDTFDDLALLLTSRTPDSRLMPLAPEVTSWMTVDSDYPTTLDFQHTGGSAAQQPRLTSVQVPEHVTSGWHHPMNQNIASSSSMSTQSHPRHLEPDRLPRDYAQAEESAPSAFTDNYCPLHPWPE